MNTVFEFVFIVMYLSIRLPQKRGLQYQKNLHVLLKLKPYLVFLDSHKISNANIRGEEILK